MKKTQISNLLLSSMMISLVTSVAVSYAEAPPSVSSPFGGDSIDEAPPSLGSETTTTTPPPKTTTPPPTTTKDTTTKTTSTSTSTGSTTSSSSGSTSSSSSTTPTPKKLSKTGPELAVLVLPSLLAGYFIGKGKKK